MTKDGIDRRTMLGTMASAGFLATSPLRAEDSTWTLVRSQLFGDRMVADDGAYATLVAPVRAEDAALVPIDIHLAVPAGDARSLKAVTLVVDENPSPLVARFAFPDELKTFDMSTRVRVNSYSFVRAIAETSDGVLHMSKSFVKAAGGCSAPAAKDPAQAQADVGKMRFRVFTTTGRDEAQLQIRHPNYSGMQMNQVTRLYTPAWFIEHLRVKQGDKLLFTLDGGISLSEDPTFRFSYRADGDTVSIEAKDSNGNQYSKVFPAGGSA